MCHYVKLKDLLIYILIFKNVKMFRINHLIVVFVISYLYKKVANYFNFDLVVLPYFYITKANEKLFLNFSNLNTHQFDWLVILLK